MSELVTDEAVEAAARALYESRSHSDDETWDEVHANVQIGTREWARAALEAAAPLIAGRALREAALDIPGSNRAESEQIDPHDRAAEWLIERADDIEAPRG